MEATVKNLTKICFAASRIMKVETVFFARDLGLGRFSIIAGHGIACPATISFRENLPTPNADFIQFPNGTTNSIILSPLEKDIAFQYLGYQRACNAEQGCMAFFAASRNPRGEIDQDTIDAFSALHSVQIDLLVTRLRGMMPDAPKNVTLN